MKQIILIMIAFLAFASSGHANEECGRYLSYSAADIESLGPAWNDLSLSRYYNSGSEYEGWFGTGWGSTFETRLQINPDGTLVMFENGISNRTVFHPPGFTPEFMAAELGRAIKSDGWLATGATGPEPDSPEYHRSVAEDEKLCHRTYAVNNSLVAPKIFPGGTVYEYRHGCLGGEIVASATGYKYTKGKDELYFGRNGRLVRVRKESQADISIGFLGRQIILASDNGGKIILDLNENSRVTHIETPGSELIYNYSRDLPVSVVSMGEVLSYYIHDENRRLKVYEDQENRARQINYQGDSFEKDTVVDLADGKWEKTTVSPLATGFGNTEVKTARGYSGNAVVVSECTNIKQRDDFGYLWLSEKQCASGGRVTTTTYNLAGMPLRISRGDGATKFTYNGKGLLVRKENRGEVIELGYDERFDKISRVSKSYPGGEGRPPMISSYSYDDRGNLIKANGPNGDEIRLGYNEQERIASMEHVGNSTLEFTYNKFGKPTVISVKGGSAVTVSYDELGEISEVDSDDGHKAALKITRAFQKLLSVVKPAGVNLEM